jgi:hypothetical protein
MFEPTSPHGDGPSPGNGRLELFEQRLHRLEDAVAALTSWYWLPGTSLLPAVVSSILVKAVDLILAFVLYKILSREARRYRAACPESLARAHQP